ncbi:ATP-binding protein [Streptomyces sp. PA03-1a]|nr:ATP-binding protein [Streptomyces sp. PA03-1a]
MTTPADVKDSQRSAPVAVFTRRLSSTRRGARLARLLAAEALTAWGYSRDSELAIATAQIVAELAANAVTHGHVPGRDVEVQLALDGRVLRIAVSDARGEQRPQASRAPADSDSGRGLPLVAALASRWGTDPRAHVGKTVWAELQLPEDGVETAIQQSKSVVR